MVQLFFMALPKQLFWCTTMSNLEKILLFIYAEVLGMVAAFYQYRKIPITLPIFIAITALCRLIILQGKGISTIDLIYEGLAVLLLAVSILIIQYGMKLSKNSGEDDH